MGFFMQKKTPQSGGVNCKAAKGDTARSIKLKPRKGKSNSSDDAGTRKLNYHTTLPYYKYKFCIYFSTYIHGIYQNSLMK